MISVLSRWRMLAFGVCVVLSCSWVFAAEISVQQAVEKVQRDTHAKVLSVQTLQVGKRKIYRIKVLSPGGQVRVIEVKATE